MIEVEYDCGCKYFHYGERHVESSHICADHRTIIIQDRLKEMKKEESLPWTDPLRHP